MRTFFLRVFLCCFPVALQAQGLQSPEQFLGYTLGTQFTPHYKVVAYFQSVAAAMPAVVKLQQYGQTNEGRPLLVVFVGTPDNIQHLEDIRKNNLRLAGLLTDQAGTETAPAITWLSYNVHGNEPSSSEAAMKTLYALVNPQNQQAQGWLEHTLVVIDPCLNPDGRDRYVNWFNQQVGRHYNVDPDAREHNEPWPGGRSNHYNFDLNRDWLWQTQLESQGRMKLYNDWLPQVHVDYHEQGYNAPYYFAPAAEPYHEVITDWQRRFQVEIGRNHARYFDEHGWLFFTRQEFDLFYPSYGDTYPLYNGSIGMTYEQGGHSRGGLGVVTQNGDTLTLEDRVLHHYTTGMSTVEMAAKNAAQLVREFHTYFTNSVRNGVGIYSDYVVKVDSSDWNRVERLKQLLRQNKIVFGSGKGVAHGLNYFTGKDESFTIDANDLVISGRQPKATLVKVLFEAQSKLTDSATYDITAWGLPYVFGVKTYAVKEQLAVGSSTSVTDFVPFLPAASAYGYAIPWNSMNSADALSFLLQHNVKVRISERPFEEKGRTFEAGSLIVLPTSNGAVKEGLVGLLQQVNQRFKVPVVGFASGFVDKGFDMGSGFVRSLKAPKVALVTGSSVSSTAAGEVWHFFEQELDYPVTLINAEDFGSVRLGNYDVVILPDGFYSWLGDKKTGDLLKSWVSQGGKLIALEGAVSQLALNDWGVKLKKGEDDKKKEDDKKDVYEALKPYGARDRYFLRSSIPGSIYRVDLDNTHPLGFGFPNFYYTLRMDNSSYQYLEDGWNVGVIKKNNYVSGFVGSAVKEKQQDGLIFGVQDMGRGRVVMLVDNPLFRNFWENGKLLFSNAVFMVGE